MENNDNGLNTDQKNKNITRRNALKIIGYCVVGGAVAGYGINKIVKNNTNTINTQSRRILFT